MRDVGKPYSHNGDPSKVLTVMQIPRISRIPQMVTRQHGTLVLCERALPIIGRCLFRGVPNLPTRSALVRGIAAGIGSVGPTPFCGISTAARHYFYGVPRSPANIGGWSSVGEKPIGERVATMEGQLGEALPLLRGLNGKMDQVLVTLETKPNADELHAIELKLEKKADKVEIDALRSKVLVWSGGIGVFAFLVSVFGKWAVESLTK